MTTAPEETTPSEETTTPSDAEEPRAEAPPGLWTEGWRRALINQATPEEVAGLLRDAAAHLEMRMGEQPKLFEDVVAVIGQVAAKPVSPRQWEELHGPLAIVLGVEAPQLLAWLVEDAHVRVEELARHASPHVTAFVRRIVARCFTELETTWRSWQEMPRDWKTVLRDVSFDAIDRRWLIGLDIHHYDGTHSNVRMTAPGLMRLITYLLSTVPLVGSADEYPENVQADFRDQLQRVIDFFVGDEVEFEEGEGEEEEAFVDDPVLAVDD